MTHPYVELLRDRRISALWAGLALSAVGSELYRVGTIWLAAELVGPKASFLVTAQSAAILLVSVFGGPLVEAVPRRIFLVWGEVLSAAASAAVVAVGLAAGLSFPLLVAASVLTVAIGAMQRPVLLSSLPHLASGRVREVNGLFDSTSRVAQAVGPLLAAATLKVMPAIHLLTANAASYLASAAALAFVGRKLDGASAPSASTSGFLQRLGRGVAAANGCPGVWGVVLVTGLRGGFYALGYMVAVPLLFAERPGTGGLAGVAIVFGATAVTEMVTTPMLVLTHPVRPLRRLYEGYALIGLSLALMGLAAGLPDTWRTPAMAATGVLIGLGNSAAGLQMMTFFASRLPGDDYAAVLRLRQVTIISAMMLATLMGPLILGALGTARTILACGLVATAGAIIGLAGRPARTLGQDFQPTGVGD